MAMRRLFKKGEHVRSKTTGNVMEVLKYTKENLINVKLYDSSRREVYFNTIAENNLVRY